MQNTLRRTSSRLGLARVCHTLKPRQRHAHTRGLERHPSTEMPRFSLQGNTLCGRLEVQTLALRNLLHLKRIGQDNLLNQVLKGVPIVSHAVTNPIFVTPIRKFQISAQRIGHDFTNHCSSELAFFLIQQVGFQRVQIVDILSIRQLSSRINLY